MSISATATVSQTVIVTVVGTRHATYAIIRTARLTAIHLPTTDNPQPATHNPQPTTHNPQPTIHNPQLTIHNPQTTTHNHQPSTCTSQGRSRLELKGSYFLSDPGCGATAAEVVQFSCPANHVLSTATRIERLGERCLLPSSPVSIHPLLIAMLGWRFPTNARGISSPSSSSTHVPASILWKAFCWDSRD
jgi:hypothetical protein